MAEYNEDVSTIIIKKYPVGCDVDKELIFDFPYILHQETVAYIESNARVMFIIRGPPSTGKATLSEMLTERYPNAVYCCADRYFTNSFRRQSRTKENIAESHVYCQKKVETACKNNVPTLIVQNTHMRKWEMQVYLDFAATYSYTVIMAITLYRFDCTPKALAENNTDGLDINYFKNRLRQWEDVLPVFTGWFISPDDSLIILNLVGKSLEPLLSDGKFSRIFDVYDTADIRRCFKPRKMLCCIAACMKNPFLKKKYYLSDAVQTFYGKCFTLLLYGYLVSQRSTMAIVQATSDMNHLLNQKCEDKFPDLDYMMDSLTTKENLDKYSALTSFPDADGLPLDTTVVLEDRDENEEIHVSKCSFIDLARSSNVVNMQAVQEEFRNVLKSITDNKNCISIDGCTELGEDDDNKVYRLPNDVWLIKPAQTIKVKSVFTGLYI